MADQEYYKTSINPQSVMKNEYGLIKELYPSDNNDLDTLDKYQNV